MNQNSFTKKESRKGKQDFPLTFRLIALMGTLLLSTSLYAAEREAVVAKVALERGHVLTRTDLQMQTVRVSGTRSAYLTNPAEAVGMTLKRRLRAGQPISRAHLDSPLLVERGQRVLMVAHQDGIEARTLGEAMKKGRKGETIKVKNESSQRVVSAVVADAGVVRMLNAAGQ
ncbi:flagellar basal body P-ring formation protein FlgA [Cedecea davisae]|uniref:Flagella basal body P-ring formation protein FlgA n=1 Tax=Cedecea davisae TaxID=158484 RepID=A0ABS6DMN5_9ENTR|nr:flagellar basal body P-ring formation chaperone FlgA [Cedecea davisae]MBU4684485.1 flagellar basal body P-ring formation protein FlgA [Cedecea davisae]MBU4688669.1 flagellar basal body P-ring formation protein FlgA [Cedecea davisae]